MASRQWRRMGHGSGAGVASTRRRPAWAWTKRLPVAAISRWTCAGPACQQHVAGQGCAIGLDQTGTTQGGKARPDVAVAQTVGEWRQAGVPAGQERRVHQSGAIQPGARIAAMETERGADQGFGGAGERQSALAHAGGTA